jgi:hypothetical protein
MDKTLIPKVKSLPSFGFYSNDTDSEEENQDLQRQDKLDVCDGSSTGNTMGDYGGFSVL